MSDDSAPLPPAPERSPAERQADRLRLLAESSNVFAEATTDAKRLFDLVARRFAEVVGDGCYVRLLGDDGVTLEPVATFHPDPDVQHFLRETTDGIALRVGEGISGKVVETGTPVLMPVVPFEQYRKMTKPEFVPTFERLGVSSMIVVRLRARGASIGFIALVRNGTGRAAYTEDDLHLVEDLADRAALAIENARLVLNLERRVRERTEELEAANRRAVEANEELERRVEERTVQLKSAEERFLHSQKMEAIGRLAGSIAHDFNNILSVIISYSSILITDLKPVDPMRADLEEIKKASERAADLTRQLLAFSRQQVMEPRVMKIDSIIAGAERMLRRLLGEDVTLETRLRQDTWLAKVDPGQMDQVIMNLAINARDAMPKGGKLTIETSNVDLDDAFAAERGVRAGPHVMLAISDTGVGMDKGTQARIFEPFFTTKERGKGTGLGLSTVFGIVQQSGGSVWVYSEAGKGTTFKIYLPKAVEGDVGESSPELAPTVLAGTETILLAEDEDQVRHVARGILERFGYVVLEAKNAGEALLICESHTGTIHLLLTDVVMPQMSGRQLAERIGAVRADMPVLFMSGYTENAIVHHGVLDSGLAYLQKPFTPDGLARKVRQVIDGRVRAARPRAPA